MIAKKITTICCLVSFVILSIVFQGCEKEDSFPSEYSEFLHVDLSTENYTPEQLAIFEKAKDRMDKYVNIKRGKFTITIKSGKEINISEELYEKFLSMMDFSNSIIRDKEYSIIDNKIILKAPYSNAPSVNIPRLKSGNPEQNLSDPYAWNITCSWHGCDVYLGHNQVSLLLAGGAVCGILAPEPIITKTVGVVLVICNTLYHMEGGKGVTIHLNFWGFNNYTLH